ncbi:phosphatase 2C-like domain-containing protein [Spinellus fusiger]|nr:phosphatase 2C-like domain-containing protein [Spinellus fusiger]
MPLLFNNSQMATLTIKDCALERPKPSYTFAYGAEGYAKKRHLAPTPTTPGPVSVPTEKQDDYRSVQVGEDAYFQRLDSLGVADGVGGWSGAKVTAIDRGLEANIYFYPHTSIYIHIHPDVDTCSHHSANVARCSQKLMHYCYIELDRYDNIDDPCFYEYDKANPVTILQKSYDEASREETEEGIIGSTTACIALLRHSELRIANLGDCGISIIRNSHYLFRSEEQQHSFNFPFQLGTGSPDKPTDAQVFTIQVERGDIIILGSDGLYDNLFDRDILSTVNNHISPYIMPSINQRPARILNFDPQPLAKALADRAKGVSEDRRNVDSPFQTRAIQEGFYYQAIQDSEDSPDRRL